MPGRSRVTRFEQLRKKGRGGPLGARRLRAHVREAQVQADQVVSCTALTAARLLVRCCFAAL